MKPDRWIKDRERPKPDLTRARENNIEVERKCLARDN